MLVVVATTLVNDATIEDRVVGHRLGCWLHGTPAERMAS